MNESKVREAICTLGRSLFDRGYTHGTSGNVSVILDDGRLIVTPTQSSLGNLDPARLTVIDPQGVVIDGPQPSKELPLHKSLYRSRGEARAIVHLHSAHSVAVSMLPNIDPTDVFPPLTAYYLMTIGRTALLPYFRPGDPQVAHAISALEGRYSAILLANHGPVVAGTTLNEAGSAIEELEQTARLHLLTVGRTPMMIPQSEVMSLRIA